MPLKGDKPSNAMLCYNRVLTFCYLVLMSKPEAYVELYVERSTKNCSYQQQLQQKSAISVYIEEFQRVQLNNFHQFATTMGNAENLPRGH